MGYSESPLGSIEQRLKELSKDLAEHVREDKQIHEKAQVPQYEYREASKMGMDNISDKVNINVGDGGGMGGGLSGLAALMMANRGDDSQSNIWASILPALTNQDRGGMGGNSMWPLLLLLLARGGHGGLFGGNDCDNGGGGAETRLQSNADTLAILNGINSNKDAITGGFSTTALALSQGFANTKDAVQALALFQSGQLNNINQNVSDQGCKTRETVQAGTTAVLQRLDDLRIRELEHDRDRAERAIEVNALRSQVEITNTNTATATQAQGQFQNQLQFQDINNKIDRLCGVVNIANQTMLARQAQDIVNLGTMTASGTQAAANTQVR